MEIVNLPTVDDLPRTRSTRDALVAPLRVPTRNLTSNLIDPSDRVDPAYSNEQSSEDGMSKVEVRPPFPQLRCSSLIGVKGKTSGRSQWQIRTKGENAFEMAELDDWEDRIIWGPPPSNSYLFVPPSHFALD